jgi:dienelactone hydrolase
MMHKLIGLMFLGFSVMIEAGGRFHDYAVNGSTYEGYYVSAGANAPLVMVVHDWDGLTEYEVKRANMLAELGYSAFAADLFGKGIRPTEVMDKKQHTGELYQDRAKMRSLLNAALETAESLNGKSAKRVAMGYCFGGAAVLEMARAGMAMQGFVSFHGGLSTPEGQDYKQARGKVLVMHGTADTAISMSEFAALANELEAAGVAHEMISYGGAPHAFTVFGGDRYHEQADRLSWQRLLNFLDEL